MLDEFLTEHSGGAMDSRASGPTVSKHCHALGAYCIREVATDLRCLRNGITSVGMAELILHIGVYADAPSAVEDFRACGPIIDADMKVPCEVSVTPHCMASGHEADW